MRLKEHGQDVLVLEKIPANIKAADGSLQVQYKYAYSITYIAVADRVRLSSNRTVDLYSA